MGSNPCHLQERPLQGGTGPQSRRLPGSGAQQPRGGNGTHVEVDLCACSRRGIQWQGLPGRKEPAVLVQCCHRRSMLSRHPDGLFPTFLRADDGTNLQRCPKTSALRIRGSRLSPGLSTLSPDCLTAHLKR